ncbi:unnamed protein product [Amoebophrya sp. A25]|nr:unnamed protein product [Amoebophrya sp. A25]|eukprot:GSA25T00012283001.1
MEKRRTPGTKMIVAHCEDRAHCRWQSGRSRDSAALGNAYAGASAALGERPQPGYLQWDAYCRMTAGVDWSRDCENFFDCVLGCDISKDVIGEGVHGGNLQTKLFMLSRSNVKSAYSECELEKYRSYCMRKTQGTCREVAFQEACENWKAVRANTVTPCDVDCSAASPRHPQSFLVLLTVSVFL